MTKTTKVRLGSISHGTMRPEDLLPEMLYWLGQYDHASELRQRIVNCLDALEDEDGCDDLEGRLDAALSAGDSLDDLCSEAMGTLDELSPDYCYFGARPGDGANYGFWLFEDWQQMMRDDDVLIVASLVKVPQAYNGLACVINDHGNASLLRVTPGRTEEIWAIVSDKGASSFAERGLM